MGIAWGALSGFAVVGYLWIRRFLRAHGWTPQDER